MLGWYDDSDAEGWLVELVLDGSIGGEGGSGFLLSRRSSAVIRWSIVFESESSANCF